MKAFLITAGSFALTAGVLANAYLQKRQFYPSVVYITKSSPSLAVLYIQAFVFVILFGKLLRKIFFGQLRAAELEHLIERSWYAVTETCLAFTVFRDDFSPRFVVLFTLLLFLKSFHWLAEDRVDYMERSPLISLLFHSRVVSLLSCLALLDVYSINHAYYSTLMKGASVQLVFGFEYAILLTIVLHILVKYILHTVDLQNENPWENKAVFLLYAELLLGFVKVILYMLFLAIMIKVHTFPLFAIRPMYLAMRTFKKALNDVIMSRRAIRNMNTLYPNATPEELASGDNVCIICREDMTEGCKKLPCNHIFHMTCLRSWFQRQQTCPTCRMDVLRAAPPAPAPRPPPAQPPAAPAPQPPFGMFPGFGMWPQDQQAAPQQPPGSAPAASPAAAPSAPSSPGAPVSPPMSPAPMMMPPFFMPPTMPFSMPMPAPPTDLSGLSDAELAAMEGTEQRHLEARVECLRQIQVLLDAAVTQMQQYTQAVSHLSAPPTMWQPAPGPNLLSSAAAAPTTPTPSILTPIPSATLSSSSSPSAALSPSGRKDATVGDITSSAPGAPADELEGAVGYTDPAAASMPTADESQDDSSINEVRRRRLERFSSSTTQDGQQETKADKLDLD